MFGSDDGGGRDDVRPISTPQRLAADPRLPTVEKGTARRQRIVTWLMTARSTADFRHVDNSMVVAAAQLATGRDSPGERTPRA